MKRYRIREIGESRLCGHSAYDSSDEKFDELLNKIAGRELDIEYEDLDVDIDDWKYGTGVVDDYLYVVPYGIDDDEATLTLVASYLKKPESELTTEDLRGILDDWESFQNDPVVLDEFRLDAERSAKSRPASKLNVKWDSDRDEDEYDNYVYEEWGNN